MAIRVDDDELRCLTDGLIAREADGHELSPKERAMLDLTDARRQLAAARDLIVDWKVKSSERPHGCIFGDTLQTCADELEAAIGGGG